MTRSRETLPSLTAKGESSVPTFLKRSYSRLQQAEVEDGSWTVNRLSPKELRLKRRDHDQSEKSNRARTSFAVPATTFAIAGFALAEELIYARVKSASRSALTGSSLLRLRHLMVWWVRDGSSARAAARRPIEPVQLFSSEPVPVNVQS